MTSPFQVATQSSGETAVAAVAAQAQAAIQARYMVAMARPRDFDDVRVRLLKECRRPALAEVAIYSKPVGGTSATGFSIRFAEAAIICMRNILPEVQTVFDDDEKRVIRISVTDLEANVTYSTDKTIDKTVERRNSNGYEVLRERLNKKGERVFIVRATEDDLAVKEASVVSKAIRTNGLRLIPGDLLDEAYSVINETLENKAKQDPDGERKKMVDAFASISVQPSDLKAYLGHDLDKCSPAQIVSLRALFRTIKEGESTWADIMAAREKERLESKPKSEADAERSNLLRKLASAKQARFTDFSSALADAGIGDPNVTLEKIDVAILAQVAQAIDASAKARAAKPEAANGKGG